MSDHRKSDEVLRQHLLRQLKDIFAEMDCIIVEGAPGMGKSTLLRHFSEFVKPNAFALTIRSSSRWAYSPKDLALDLAADIEHHLSGNQKDLEGDPEALLFGEIRKLRRKASREGRRYYFLVDGLELIPESDSVARRQILTFLPLGDPHFKFLFSDAKTGIVLQISEHSAVDSFKIPLLSPEEAAVVLRSVELSSDQFQQIYDITRGIPANLASIRRILKDALDPDEVLRRLPTEHSDIFALEWQQVDLRDRLQLCVIGILANENRAYTPAEIAAILRPSADSLGLPIQVITETRIRELLEGFTFISKDEATFQFVHEKLREYAQAQLGEHHLLINDLFIRYLSLTPADGESLARLPALIANTGDLRRLVEFLSPEHFASLIHKAPTIKLVQEQADIGISAARKLRRDDDLIRFAIQRSSLEELAASKLGTAEAKALVSLGEYEGAKARADAAPRIDVRFRLLAAIAGARAELGQPPDPVLIADIRRIFPAIDATSFGDALGDVAVDLFHAAPDLALELIGKTPRDGERAQNAMDFALLRMAIEAEIQHSAARRAGLDDVRTIHEGIQNPVFKQLSTHVSMAFGRRAAATVLKEAERIESIGDRLYLMQRWMLANRTRPDAHEVLAEGLRLALDTTDFVANASVVRQLCVCLPYIKAEHGIRYFVDRLSAQFEVLRQLGPSEEYVRLRLIVARAIKRIGPSEAVDHLVNVYNEISLITEPIVRAACVARLMSTLTRVGALPEVSELAEIVEAELSNRVDAVLRHSADHFDTIRGVIVALAGACPRQALEIVRRLNTEYRRDLAYHAFVESAVEGPLEEVSACHITEAIDSIVDRLLLDDAIENAVRAQVSRVTSPEHLDKVVEIIRRTDEVGDSPRRTRLYCYVISYLAPLLPNDHAITKWAVSGMRRAWDMVEDGWRKLELGYDVVARLARAQPELARDYIAEVNSVRERVPVLDEEGTTAAVLGLSLAIRAYAGLLPDWIDDKVDLGRLLEAVRRSGLFGEQIRLLTELAVRAHFGGRGEIARDVVTNELVPAITSVPTEDRARLETAIIGAAPALYLGAQGLAVQWFTQHLSVASRDEAIHMVAWTLLRKVPPTDPYEDGDGRGFIITFDEAAQLINLAANVRSDWLVYDIIVAIVDSILGRSKDSFKRPQKAEIARQLTSLADAHFPTPGYIEHEGYLIAAHAQINRMRDGRERLEASHYARKAMAISNSSDRAYVLGIIAATARTPGERREFVAKARAATDEIEILGEKIDRLWALSNLVAPYEMQEGRELLRSAYTLALQGEGETFAERRESLIGLAYRRDPNLAASLATMSDDDPVKPRIERRLQLYRLRDGFGVRAGRNTHNIVSRDDFAKALWLKLASLNARRAAPVPSRDALDAITMAAAEPISTAYPMFAWFIENAVRRMATNQREVREYVLPMFEACLRGAELALVAAQGVMTPPRLMLPDLDEGDHESVVRLVGYGNRTEGVEFLRQWLRSESPRRLYIADRYFDLAAVELLGIIKDEVPNVEIIVLTSRNEATKGVSGRLEEAYLYAWRQMRDDEPPTTQILFGCTRESGSFPIHDRWWFSEGGAGLYLGTSFSGLGVRTAKLRILEPDEANADLRKLLPFFRQERIQVDGDEMMYASIML